MSQLTLNKEHTEDFTDRETFFVEVILPLSIPGTYTYRVPQNMESQVMPGGRVVVQFGKNRILTGIIHSIHQKVPDKYEAKYLLECLDDVPSFTASQIDFFAWVASYYMCTIGEVVNAALPSGLKLSNESFIQLNPEQELSNSRDELSNHELKIVMQLTVADRMSYADVADLLEIKMVHPIIKSLIQKGYVLIFDKIKEKFSPKKEKFVKLNSEQLKGEESLKLLFEKLESRPKQLDILLKFLQLIGFDGDGNALSQEVQKKDLLVDNLSPSSYQTLIKNEVFDEQEKIVPRFLRTGNQVFDGIELSNAQSDGLLSTLQAFQKNKPVLLHGVTGSGKTEIYIELIRQVIAEGGQVLYLLPEIALTTQIVNRLLKIFGDEVGVYHSRYSDNERVEVWNDVKYGKLKFVVGVRSSIFLPFDDLSLIVVDEEHDPSFKQYDPSPRFHARDCAIWLANQHGARILLGSATPSIESYQNALDSKYEMVSLTDRFGDVALPNIKPANTLTSRKSKRMKGDFTPELLTGIETSLGQQKQVIIFQNRRGYSPYLICDDCNHVPKCQNCDVSLTYHMNRRELVCHYCGFKEPLPSTCEACGSTSIRTVGFGTEKLEDDLKLLFPEAKIERMDQDTTRSKNSYQLIIDRFEKRETDILVGTQMISKGLDFDNVSLVGILDFDRFIHFPDFRSFERAFQMTTQVAGRSGRKERGDVILQTSDPDHKLVDQIIRSDYQGFFSNEILDREKYHYPPFYRLIRITIKSLQQDVSQAASKVLTDLLIPDLGSQRVLGPQSPLIGRIKNLYLEELIIKVEKSGVSLSSVKSLLYKKAMEVKSRSEFKSIRVVFDVDPV